MFKKLVKQLQEERHIVRQWQHLTIDLRVSNGKPDQITLLNETADDIEVIEYNVLYPVSAFTVVMRPTDTDSGWSGWSPEHTMIVFSTELSGEDVMELCIEALETSVQQ